MVLQRNSIPDSLHIEGFFKFMTLRSRRRMVALFNGNKKAQKKFYSKLAHDVEFQENYMLNIDASFHTPEGILKLIFEYGKINHPCYIISSDGKLNNRYMKLDEALENVVGYTGGTFISILPGELGFVEYAEMSERYLLVRKW